MNERRKTNNPYEGALDEAKRHSAWSDGYVCGHSDAEMDERDNVVSLTNEFNKNMLHTIDSQAQEISNLVEKNDNQVTLIKRLDERINQFRVDRDNTRREMSRRGNEIMALEATLRHVPFSDKEYKRGHQAGVDAAVSDMVVFAQSTGSTIKFLTSDQYDTLVKVAAELGVMDDKISDLGAVIAEHVVSLDETLGDIECPPR